MADTQEQIVVRSWKTRWLIDCFQFFVETHRWLFGGGLKDISGCKQVPEFLFSFFLNCEGPLTSPIALQRLFISCNIAKKWGKSTHNFHSTQRVVEKPRSEVTHDDDESGSLTRVLKNIYVSICFIWFSIFSHVIV